MSENKFNIINLKRFNFLFMADMTPRKGWQYLLEAYCKEFRPEENVSLTFKVYFKDFSLESQQECKGKIKDFANTIGYNINGNTAPIYFYGHCLPNNLVPKFVNSFDCLVSPHSGEAWGLLNSEAMLLKKIVIATNYSGNLEFMNSSNSLLIDIDKWIPIPEEMIQINPNYYGLEWPVPSVTNLRKLMRQAFKENMNQLKQNAHSQIINNFNYEIITNKIQNAIQEILATKKDKVVENADIISNNISK